MPACAHHATDPAASPRRRGGPAAARDPGRAAGDRGPGVKICGVGAAADIDAAAAGGARYVGFVFYPPSPRALAPPAAARLAARVPAGIRRVALFVDPEDSLLDAVLGQVPVDCIQLHGAESADRGRAIRRRTGLPVIRSVRLRDASDLPRLAEAEGWADQVLCDARPAGPAALPGGNGLPFDWQLIRHRAWKRPWLLAGGLSPANVGEAVRVTGARQVDVSSGIESAPGRKDPARILAFLHAAGAGTGEAAA